MDVADTTQSMRIKIYRRRNWENESQLLRWSHSYIHLHRLIKHKTPQHKQ